MVKRQAEESLEDVVAADSPASKKARVDDLPHLCPQTSGSSHLLGGSIPVDQEQREEHRRNVGDVSVVADQKEEELEELAGEPILSVPATCPPLNASPSSNHHDVPAPSMGPSTKTRKRKAPTLRAVDWEPYKARIIELHITQKLSLKEVKDTMEREFGFVAEYVAPR